MRVSGSNMYGQLFVVFYLVGKNVTELQTKKGDHPLLAHVPALQKLSCGGPFLWEFARYTGNKPSPEIILRAVTQYRYALVRALEQASTG